MNEPVRLYLDTEVVHPAGRRKVNIYRTSDTNIKYIRNDAFIEKTVSYLNSKLYDCVQTTNPNQRSYANTIMKQDFIEDFKNYMKGE